MELLSRKEMRHSCLARESTFKVPFVNISLRFVSLSLRGVATNPCQFCGELVGTFLFLFFAYGGTEVANRRAPATGADASTLLYISLAFGFSLAVNAWVFFRISGGLFNPAVTLGLMLIGSLTYTRAAIVFVAQILGAMGAAGVVLGLFPGVSWQNDASEHELTLRSHSWQQAILHPAQALPKDYSSRCS